MQYEKNCAIKKKNYVRNLIKESRHSEEARSCLLYLCFFIFIYSIFNFFTFLWLTEFNFIYDKYLYEKCNKSLLFSKIQYFFLVSQKLWTKKIVFSIARIDFCIIHIMIWMCSSILLFHRSCVKVAVTSSYFLFKMFGQIIFGNFFMPSVWFGIGRQFFGSVGIESDFPQPWKALSIQCPFWLGMMRTCKRSIQHRALRHTLKTFPI